MFQLSGVARIIVLLCFFLLGSSSFCYSQGILGTRWQLRLGGNDIWKIIAASDGTLMGVGYVNAANPDAPGYHTSPSGTIPNDVWVVRMDINGNVIWKKCYGSHDTERGYAIVETTDNKFIVVADCKSGGSGDLPATGSTLQKPWVFKIDTAGNMLWSKVYHGNEFTFATDIIKVQGGYVLAGQSRSTGLSFPGNHGWHDAMAMKIDETGNMLWSKQYGGSSIDVSLRLSPASNGGFYLAGAAMSTNGNITNNLTDDGYDAWITKSDSAGTVIWSKVYERPDPDHAYNVLEYNGSIYISSDRSVTGKNSEFSIIKTDTAGVVRWSKTYGGNMNEGALKLIPVNNNSFIVVGSTNSRDSIVPDNHGLVMNPTLSTATYDVWVIMIDSLGNLTGKRAIGGTKNDTPTDAFLLPGGDLVITGITDSPIIEPDMMSYPANKKTFIMRLGKSATIKGSIYVDFNNNGVKDSSDIWHDAVLIEAKKGVLSYGNRPFQGMFNISTDTGTYTTRPILTNNYYNALPASATNTLNSYFQTDSVGFRLVPAGIKKDLIISVLPLGTARPGFPFRVRLEYRNAGNQIQSGQVKLVKPSRASVDSMSLPALGVTGDTITWNYSNLAPFSSGSVTVYMRLAQPPVLVNGDTLVFKSEISPVSGDETPLNNGSTTSVRTRGSFDPNDKTETHNGRISLNEKNAGEYLQYVVRFQNTGTDTAFKIVITDTLDSRLDLSTLEMISASAPYQMMALGGNRITWTFPDIQLPDSNSNESRSHGFIAYRIRLKAAANVGDTMKNSASIYFDYNLPVKTNTEQTILYTSIATALPGMTLRNSVLTVYPNPSRQLVSVKLQANVKGNASLLITDMQGRKVFFKALGKINASNGFVAPVDLYNLTSGIYQVILNVEGKEYRQQLVLQ